MAINGNRTCTQSRALRDDVVHLTVVGKHVDRDLRVEQGLGKLIFDRLSGLANRQTGDVGAAIDTQIDGAIRSNNVLAANRLLTCRLGQRNGDFRCFEDRFEMLGDRGGRLVDIQIDDLHLAVGRP